MCRIKLYTGFYLILLLFFTTGCNTDKHYRTLSLFFDGVPEPVVEQIPLPDSVLAEGDSAQQVTGSPAPGGEKTITSVHPIYKPNKCDQCHDINHSYRLNQRQPTLCYHCHQDYKAVYKKVHGPVAAGYCTACHEPHQSEFKHLLKQPARENCQYCHQAGDVAKNTAHEDVSEIECLECHNPHGGEDKFFLN